MTIKALFNKHWKVITWSLAAAGINLLILLPLPATVAALNFEGIAFAQTGPPDDTPTPIPTATPTSPIQTSNQAQSQPLNQNSQTPTATFTPFSVATFTPTPAAATNTPASTIVSEAAAPSPTVAPPAGNTDGSRLVTGNPPPGISPLVNSGEIYQIPADPNGAGVSLPYALADDTFKVNLTIPASPAGDKIIRLEEAPAADTPVLPAGLEPLAFFNLDVYLLDSLSGTMELKIHSPALMFSVAAPTTGDEAVVLLRYDETTQQYELLPQQYDPALGIVNVLLPKTSLFVLAKDVGYTAQLAGGDAAPSTDSQPAIPQQAASTGLPEGIFLLIFVGSVGAVALFVWLGKGSLVRSRVEPASIYPEVEAQNRAGGIVLAFALPPLKQQTVITAALPLLSQITRLADTSPQEALSMGIKLAAVETIASIHPLNPNVLESAEAVTLPPHLTLVSCDDNGVQPYKLSPAIRAGILTWHGADDEIFDRLRELQTGDAIEIICQNVSFYRYNINTVRVYQSDNSSVIQIAQTTPDAQLVIIIWSEAYDVDHRVYRDYLVIQAHFAHRD